MKLFPGIVILAKNSLSANIIKITGIQPQVRKEIIVLFLYCFFLIPFYSDAG